VFDDVAKQYRRYFAWPGVQDFLHPQASLHRKMGALVFKGVPTEEAADAPWKLSAVGASFTGRPISSREATTETEHVKV